MCMCTRSAENMANAMCTATTRRLMQTVVASNKLPTGSEHEFLSAVSVPFQRQVGRVGLQLRRFLHRVTASERNTQNSSSDSSATGSPSGADHDEDVSNAVSTTLDKALDNAYTAMDEAMAAIARRSTLKAAPAAKASRAHFAGESTLELPDVGGGSKTATGAQKVQHQFHDWPLDNSDAPFLPHNERGPGNMPASDAVQEHVRGLWLNKDSASAPHPHFEAMLRARRKSQAMPAPSEPTLFRPVDKTALTVVDSVERLDVALQSLALAEEIAIDLENHSYRSFQASTRTEDFIFDTLVLRKEMWRLNDVLASENIVKVFHGADMDVQWLERDFGLYVVNLFDTGQASRALELPSFSLAYLLLQYCGVDLGESKKRFQRADWRVRPLPHDMIDYARGDTHYLLYIYDRLRMQLAERGVLDNVWQRSMNVAQRRYNKSRFEPQAARRFAERHGTDISGARGRVLVELLRWRDSVGRKEDESIAYVLPNRAVLALMRRAESIRSAEEVLAALLGEGVPPFVRQQAPLLADLVKRAFVDGAYLWADDNSTPAVLSCERVDTGPQPTEAPNGLNSPHSTRTHTPSDMAKPPTKLQANASSVTPRTHPQVEPSAAKSLARSDDGEHRQQAAGAAFIVAAKAAKRSSLLGSDPHEDEDDVEGGSDADGEHIAASSERHEPRETGDPQSETARAKHSRILSGFRDGGRSGPQAPETLAAIDAEAPPSLNAPQQLEADAAEDKEELTREPADDFIRMSAMDDYRSKRKRTRNKRKRGEQPMEGPTKQREEQPPPSSPSTTLDAAQAYGNEAWKWGLDDGADGYGRAKPQSQEHNVYDAYTPVTGKARRRGRASPGRGAGAQRRSGARNVSYL